MKIESDDYLDRGPCTKDEKRLVVVIPALNEEVYIENCINSLLPQIPSNGKIIVADGGSVDRTRLLVEALTKSNSNVQLIDNPRKNQAAAVNIVANGVAAEASLLIRADAHAFYPPNFITDLLNSHSSSDAQSVVVPMRTIGQTCFQSAAAAAQNSRLGNGGAAERNSGGSRWVDHAHHALFELRAFLSVGGYDEAFSGAAEDCEYDFRLAKQGGKIWMCSEAALTYFPRSTPLDLGRQYFRNGQGRARMFLKHRAILQLRQLLPVAALMVCVLGAIGSFISAAALLGPLTYFASALVWGCLLALHSGNACAVASGLAAVIMHLSYAAGFIAALAYDAGRITGRQLLAALSHAGIRAPRIQAN
jgi:succinoglycan biosynthesis protein ExoA